MPIHRPFGAWDSPITAAAMTEASVGLSAIGLWHDRPAWLETRPSEKGRVVLVADAGPGAPPVDLSPPDHNLRSRVHEYGGGAVAIRGDRIAYVNFGDQRLYRLDPAAGARALTGESLQQGDPAVRFADMDFDPRRERLAAVREDHRGQGEPANAIVLVDWNGGDGFGVVVDDRHDFVACPRFSPDGRWLCWLGWDHPNMPWDGCTLWRAPIDADGAVGMPERVAGGTDEAVFQPEWGPDGSLCYVSDRTGWWNLYRRVADRDEAVCPRPAEFGLPLWQFGMRSYAILPDGSLIAAIIEEGVSHLHAIAGGVATPIALPFASAARPIWTERGLLVSGSYHDRPSVLAIAELDAAAGPPRILRRSSPFVADAGFVSPAQAISFPTGSGAVAHGFYYPPANAGFLGMPGERPPLMVRSHGGPTGATSPEFSLGIQYWTSRGFAVLDVNYRGSTGYGRVYRDALKGQWGVADVEDCAAGARFLADRGLADAERLVIRGGSAGGFTTLCALTFTDVFKAGASLFGVGDLMALAGDTHKFESRYLDNLVGPLPEAEAVYAARSPLNHADRLSCPVIFLQGLEDKVVPPNQAEAMVATLRTKGVPVAYLAFEGEQHGFRQAATIIRGLEAELWFYGRVFGFTPADDIEPVPIDNLAGR